MTSSVTRRTMASVLIGFGAITVLAATPAKAAMVISPSGMQPSTGHRIEPGDLIRWKRKLRANARDLGTAHTNQPPAPPPAPPGGMQDPDQEREFRIVPREPALPAAAPLPPTPQDSLAIVIDPSPPLTIDGTLGGFTVAPLVGVLTPGAADEAASDRLVPGSVGVIPAPGALLTLLAAGLGAGRRRRD